MTTKIAINGYGRIGRCIHRILNAQHFADIELVAINDIASPTILAHLLKNDSVHGTFPFSVEARENAIVVNGKKIPVFAEKDPSLLPWNSLEVAIALECTGRFSSKEDAAKHLVAGAQKVLISAPGNGADATFVYGINHLLYNPAVHHVISNASCTTNCLAPIAKVLNDTVGIVGAQMTTIHSYTNDQRILDLPHTDLRRARAAAISMIPTSTGAAKAVGLVLPELAGKIDGIAIRVPTPNVSLVELTATVKRPTTAAEINAACREAAQGPLKGILQYTEEELVSTDYNGNSHSSIFDSKLTQVVEKTTVKMFSWYDNEWGYANRVIDMTLHMIRS